MKQELRTTADRVRQLRWLQMRERFVLKQTLQEQSEANHASEVTARKLAEPQG